MILEYVYHQEDTYTCNRFTDMETCNKGFGPINHLSSIKIEKKFK